MESTLIAKGLLSVAVGVAAHLGVFIHGEWHLQAPALALLHISSFVFLWAARLYQTSKQEYLAHYWDIPILFSLYLCGLFGSISTYRLLFHPLRSFPGPRLAALTKLWHAYQCRDSRNFRVLDRLHHKYGDFVRTGPAEISIFTPGGIEALDGAGNHNARTEWYDMLHPRVSTIFSRDENDHVPRRKVWTRALSTKSIAEYLPRINNQIAILEQVIKESDSKPILLNDLMSFFAFDSMGDFVFNQSYGMMQSGLWHKAIIQQRSALAILGSLHCTIWLVRLAFAFIPMFWKVKDFFGMVSFCDERMQQRLKSDVKSPDIAAWFIEEYERNSLKLEPTERRNLLSGNAISAIVGGSDTTGPSLILVWVMLARRPQDAEKIFQEISQLPDFRDVSALATLPHLNGFINETMRILPSALTGGNRKTPPEGITVDGTFIPGDVTICAPKYSIFRLESAFEKPEEFIPERWYSKPELIKDRRAFMPFGTGRRQCVGKGLALTQIRLVVATLLHDFTVQLAPGNDPEAVERDMRDQVTAQPGRCLVTFKSRS